MKNITLFILLFFVFLPGSHASSSWPVLIRQAKFSAKIEKTVFVFDVNGRPSWARTPVCTQQSLINVYKVEGEEGTTLLPGDLSLVQCDGELAGEKVSITVGGALNVYQKDYAGVSLPIKGTALVLSWGALSMETPQIIHSSSSDPWLNFQDLLGPVSTGKIIDGVPQAPEPSEFFTAVVNIEDGSR